MAVEFFAATEPKLAFAAVEMRGQGVLLQLVGAREDERTLGLDAGKPGRPGRMPVQFVVAFGAKGLVASLALEFGLGDVTPHDGVGGKFGVARAVTGENRETIRLRAEHVLKAFIPTGTYWKQDLATFPKTRPILARVLSASL